MWIAQVGAAPVAAAPEAVRSLIEEVAGLSFGSVLILLIYLLMRGAFRLNREVAEAHRERDEWKRLWEQERAAHRGD